MSCSVPRLKGHIKSVIAGNRKHQQASHRLVGLFDWLCFFLSGRKKALRFVRQLEYSICSVGNFLIPSSYAFPDHGSCKTVRQSLVQFGAWTQLSVVLLQCCQQLTRFPTWNRPASLNHSYLNTNNAIVRPFLLIVCTKRQRKKTHQIFFCWRAQNRIKFQLQQKPLLCNPYNPSSPLLHVGFFVRCLLCHA